MAVDSATTIAAFDTGKPAGSDPASELDNNIRHVKSVLKSNFANIGGAVTVTHADLNTVTSRALRAGDTYTGSHDFTGAAVTVPTATTADATTKAASTAFVQTAIAAVNALTALTLATSASASISATVGQHVVATNAATVTVTLPSGATAGQRVRVTFTNSLFSNVIDPGSEKIFSVSGTRLVNQAKATVEFVYVNSSIGWVF